MKNYIKLLVGILLVAFLLAGCGQQQDLANNTTQDTNETVDTNETSVTTNQTYEKEINESLDGVEKDVEIGELV